MIERLDSDADALGDGLDVVLQGGLGARVAEVCLDIFDTRYLSHVRRAGPPQHLMGHAGDSCLFPGLLQDPEMEVVGIDRSGPS